MTPKIDFVTSTFRSLWDPQAEFNPEDKLSEIDRAKRLFTAARLGFSWMGIAKEGNPDAFSDAKGEIKQIEGPFVFATLGRKVFKFVRLTNLLAEGQCTERVWRKWTSAGVSMVGKSCQTALFANQAMGWGGMGFALDAVIASASTLTSLVDTCHLGLKCAHALQNNSSADRKKYLLLKLVQAVMGLACSLFTLIGLFSILLQPAAPLAFTLLGTACLILNVARFYFKKEAVEDLSKFQYNGCQFMRHL
ncbi:MAG: hypothetical protein K940chlam2_00067 [Chlamydiae bacterium]|nr:hypothetical protein [Chlamydiota bacterium]